MKGFFIYCLGREKCRFSSCRLLKRNYIFEVYILFEKLYIIVMIMGAMV